MWHEVKEAYRQGRDWKEALSAYKLNLQGENPASADEIEKWAYLCAGQFMVWLKQPLPPQRIKSVQICTEDSFRVPYTLPSGRTVYLRGKYDSISLAAPALYIEDDKTKGKIDVKGIGDTMFGNLQMGLYHAAARQSLIKADDGNYHLTGLDKRGFVVLPKTAKRPYFVGTKYHIIKRPLSEHYPIKQRVKETSKEFWNRVIQDIASNPNDYFIPMVAMLTETQLDAFKLKILNPWLEALCDWWEYMVSTNYDPWSAPTSSIHLQTPWNVYNSLFGGFRGDYFDYLSKGHEGSLVRVKTLFPELASPEDANSTQAPARQTLTRPQKRNR
jgi:hypothetical protein